MRKSDRLEYCGVRSRANGLGANARCREENFDEQGECLCGLKVEAFQSASLHPATAPLKMWKKEPWPHVADFATLT